MPRLTPVEHDPFVAQRMVPVDHNPFGDIGGAMPEAYGAGAPIMDPLAKAVVSVATLPRRAFEASEQRRSGGAYDPGPALESAMMMMGTGAIAGVPVKGAEAVLGAGPIRAYHGSPHNFEKFDTGKIGAGQGAQSYGHGLYFAENPKVAETYRDMQKSPGKMYEVEIKADPEHFLDLDKPLNQQAPQVQTALKQAMGVDYFGKFDAAKSERAWSAFQHADGKTAVRQGFIASDDKLAANRLRETGIPGIKYLDEGSRGPVPKSQQHALRAAGKTDIERTRNYVVFDDKIVDILRKYGLAGLSTLPPATAAWLAQRLRPVDHDPFANEEKI